jgi:WD40 repeat protein
LAQVLEMPVSVAFSPDSKRMVSGSADGTLKVWDSQSSHAARTLMWDRRAPGLSVRNNSVASVAFSSDGKRIVSGSNGGTLKVWDAQTGEEALTLKGHTGFVQGIAFSPDGKRIVSSSNDKTLKVWGAQPGEEQLDHALEGLLPGR